MMIPAEKEKNKSIFKLFVCWWVRNLARQQERLAEKVLNFESQLFFSRVQVKHGLAIVPSSESSVQLTVVFLVYVSPLPSRR